MKKIALYLIPLGLFLGLIIFLYQGLFSNPREHQSSLLEQPMPEFVLPDLMNIEQTYNEDVFLGKVTLLNVWGVWCITCAIELPYLKQLQGEGKHIVGLYFDQDMDPDFGIKTVARVQQEVTDKLSQLGNPYAFNIFDVKRDLSMDLGVTGAPETYLIDQQGKIRLHHIGDINPRVWKNKFAPVYDLLVAQ
ncbi:redoxin family protein [Paraglaciecola arctica]|uniref:Thiol:disulfide interchange protein dsbE n=1 Tax=Paraglaciecola arctica BSs20135 TaxID=493475 RepID=K6Y2E1_9ALTE|nr:redoxin family protein [Paraglaciecola arctica]GAC18121.1 thiol:disulfide interchange protein dsbE [Paraglaciecola arctica BSs20135]